MQHMDQRVHEGFDGKGAMNVLGPNHPSMGSFKHQQNIVSQRKHIQKMSKAGGRQSPQKWLAQKQAKLSHAKNRSTEAIDVIDLPIAILDQE